MRRRIFIPGRKLIHAEDRVRIVFVPYFIDFVMALVATVKSIRAVDDDAVFIADVLVRVDSAFRNDDDLRIVFARHERHYIAVGWRAGPVVPHAQLEIRWTEETEEVGLVDMLVGT